MPVYVAEIGVKIAEHLWFPHAQAVRNEEPGC
jgi:hypothetical protein